MMIILSQVDDMVAERAARRFQQGEMAMSIDIDHTRTGDRYCTTSTLAVEYINDIVAFATFLPILYWGD